MSEQMMKCDRCGGESLAALVYCRLCYGVGKHPPICAHGHYSWLCPTCNPEIRKPQEALWCLFCHKSVEGQDAVEASPTEHQFGLNTRWCSTECKDASHVAKALLVGGGTS